MLCQYAWYLGDETWGACGYDGPWLGRVEVVSRPAPVLGVAVVAEETDDA